MAMEVVDALADALNTINRAHLGAVIDKEMTLTGLLTDIKKSVLCKLFSLRKLPRYITEKCAISIYKQTIIPVLDYVGFLLV